MPAVIFGERFRYMGEPAWHGIGTTFEGGLDITAVEAFTEAGLDYEIQTYPIYADVDGEKIQMNQNFALVRGATGDDPPMVLGTVGKQFYPVQNMTLADTLDRSGLLKSYHIETVGALGAGETIFTALKSRNGDFEIAGTPARNYWTLYDGKDGSRALGLMWTPVKTVCSNTLIMALSSATINVRIPHTSTAEADLDFWLGLTPQMERMQGESLEAIRQMTEFQLKPKQVDTILKAAYPRPPEPPKMSLRNMPELILDEAQQTTLDKIVAIYEQDALRQWQRMQMAKEVFEAYGDTPEERKLAGSAWGLYEAVVDTEDHRAGTRKNERIAQSAMFGPRATTKRLAFKAAAAMAGVA